MKESNSGRVSALRDALFNGSNKEFADAVGILPTVMSNICTGRINAGPVQIEKILKAYPNVSKSWLVTGEGEMFTDGTGVSTARLQCDTSHTCGDDAMYPDIHIGDVITAAPLSESHVIMPGSKYLVDTKSNGRFIRVLYDEGERIRCHACNDLFGDFIISKSDVIRYRQLHQLHRNPMQINALGFALEHLLHYLRLVQCVIISVVV